MNCPHCSHLIERDIVNGIERGSTYHGAIDCISNLRADLAAERAAHEHTIRVIDFPKQQATHCGKCGVFKHTPWKDDEWNYVCATCLVAINDDKIRAERTKREHAEAQLAAVKSTLCGALNMTCEDTEPWTQYAVDIHNNAVEEIKRVSDKLAIRTSERDAARAQVERLRVATWDGTGPKPACWRECERLRDQVERLKRCANCEHNSTGDGECLDCIALLKWADMTAPSAPTPAQEKQP